MALLSPSSRSQPKMRPWHAIGVFCDDIRQEVSAISLMGVYPDNLSVPRIGALPRLGTYIRIHIDPSTEISSISAKICFPNGMENEIGRFDTDHIKSTQSDSRQKGAPWSGFIITALAINVPIDAAGRILLVAVIGDEELVCGGLNVEIASDPAATASAQPA